MTPNERTKLLLDQWIEEARAICEKATPGMWHANEYESALLALCHAKRAGDMDPSFHGHTLDNACFIVYARTALPRALEIIEELRTRIDEREQDMHLRIRADYDKTVADCWRKENQDLRVQLATARAEALEEAARICDDHGRRSDDTSEIADAIRAAAKETK